MSMILEMCTLSDENIRKVLADPPLVWKVIAPDDPDIYEEARKKAAGGGPAIFRWFRKNRGTVSAELLLADGEATHEDLDKAWHGIHYMLTQSDWKGDAPLNFLLNGGTVVGDIDVGYGPARALMAEHVKVANEAFKKVDEVFLRSRFNSAAMAKLRIYPDVWDPREEDENFRYCVEHFGRLKEFMSRAAGRNLGVIIYLD